MTGEGDGGTGSSETAPPTSVEEALGRARMHARAALSESVATLQALAEAASLAASGAPLEDGRLAGAARGLDQLRAWLDPAGGRDAEALLAALHEALEGEIARWEERSRTDPEARAVLRAFLAVRELLWELGVREPAGRPAAPSPGRGAPDPEATRTPRGRGRKRVQHVSVQG